MLVTRQLSILSIVAFTAVAAGGATRAEANITIDTSNASDWKISNGMISLDWNPTTGHIFGVVLAGHPDNLVDTTTTQSGQPKGLYMDNAGTNLGSGTITTGFHQNGNHYLDWWITNASSSSNAFTYSQHFIIADNDPGVHVYFVAQHSATDIARRPGAGPVDLPRQQEAVHQHVRGRHRPQPARRDDDCTTLPRRARQHRSGSPGARRHTRSQRTRRAVRIRPRLLCQIRLFQRGVSPQRRTACSARRMAPGPCCPARTRWSAVPSKRDLIFTDNILMMEAMSTHLDNAIRYTAPAGAASSRLFGPFYVRLNAFDSTHTTAASLYQDATGMAAGLAAFYDGEGLLAQNGYVISSKRGQVSATISGGGSATANTAWVVLSDSATNFQYSATGHQYWLANPSSGSVTFSNVVPGKYRLSAYVLGQWGELRSDNVTVTAGATTAVSLHFAPENFASAAPIWTIGTPDRSARELRHGTDGTGQDDREYWGNWNYWSDFASTSGSRRVLRHRGRFHCRDQQPPAVELRPLAHLQSGLFGGAFDASDDTTERLQEPCCNRRSSATAPPPRSRPGRSISRRRPRSPSKATSSRCPSPSPPPSPT